MDITRQNFEEILPKVKESIEQATFLSIDCEFTGLNTTNNINAFDTISQYYNKLRTNSKDFLVIQYGICSFRYDKAKNVFKQSSYNFYTFRRPRNRNIPDQRFLCQTSSIDLLISQGFDFNKLFSEGIPYLNIDEESKYRAHIVERHKATQKPISSSACNDQKVLIPAADQPFIDNIIKLIEDYLESNNTEPLELPKCNPFLRKLIYQTTSEIFGKKVSVVTKQLENKDRVLYVSPVGSAEEFEKIAKEKLEKEMEVISNTVGFSKILKIVIDSGKLIVGHNLLLDIMHSIDKFIMPLPEEYSEFKECVHGLFPNILDTKLMSSSEVFKDLINSTVLGHLVDSIKQEPFIIPQIETEQDCQGYSLEDNKAHEAAYDAFITGLSFLAMWNYLGKGKNMSSEETFCNSSLLTPYLNKLYIMRLQDNQYMNLSGNDPNPTRDHVFYISFPKDWKTSDIQELFSPFGNVFISWINDTSAFVALFKREQAFTAYKSLSKHESCKITPFVEYQNSAATKSVVSPEIQLSKRKHRDTSEENKVKKLKTATECKSKLLFAENPLDKKNQVKASKTFQETDSWD